MCLNVSRLWMLPIVCSVTAGGAAAQDQSRFLLSPPPGDGPVVVQVGFFLSDVNRIDGRQEMNSAVVVALDLARHPGTCCGWSCSRWPCSSC
jgi:hypothetical protein